MFGSKTCPLRVIVPALLVGDISAMIEADTSVLGTKNANCELKGEKLELTPKNIYMNMKMCRAASTDFFDVSYENLANPKNPWAGY